jgi:hypothetical protein
MTQKAVSNAVRHGHRGLLNIRSADSGACLEIILPLSRRGAADADLAGSCR